MLTLRDGPQRVLRRARLVMVFLRTSEKMSATVQAFTAERSDEAQPTTSRLSVEASSVPEPSMSITTQISTSRDNGV